MGLKSDKNYITANAVDVILMQPKNKGKTEENYLNKKNYGKVPGYLQELKSKIENEYRTIREMQIRNEEEEAAKKKELDDSEIQALREGIRKRIEELKRSYAELSHKKVFDTLVTKRK